MMRSLKFLPLCLLLAVTPVSLGIGSTEVQAQDVSQTREEKKAIGNQLLGFGYQLFQQSQFEYAQFFGEEALAIYSEIRDYRGEGQSLGILGNVYHALGMYEDSIRCFRGSLEKFERINDLRGRAEALGSLGLVYNSLDNSEQAIKYYQQAINIAERVGDRRVTASSLENLGTIYRRKGEYKKAIKNHRESLVIKEKFRNSLGIAISQNSLGLTYFSLSEYDKSIEYLSKALATAKDLKNRLVEENSRNNLGMVYRYLGDYKQSISHHDKALSIAKDLKNPLGEANSLNNLGMLYYNLGEYHKAIDYHKQALKIARQLGSRLGEGSSLGNLGKAFLGIGEEERAISSYQQALKIMEEIGNYPGTVYLWRGLGDAYNSLEQYKQALTHYYHALKIAQENNDLWSIATLFDNLGIAHENLAQYTKAEKLFYNSIKNWEYIRLPLKDSDQISIFDTHNFAYRNLQRVLLAQSKNNAALVVSERGRSRALIQLLANSLKLDFELPNIELIKSVARQQNATIVEYSLLANQALVVWVVTPSGEIYMKKVLLNALNDSIESLARKNRLWLQQARGSEDKETEINRILRGNPKIAYNPNTNNPTQTSKDSLRKLHKYLIKPIAQYLPEDEDDRVIFIPHRSLLQVPFAALMDEEGNYLLHSHTIHTAPSIQSLIYTRQHQQRVHDQSQEVLIVGDPTIPLAANLSDAIQPLKQLKGTRKEARSIASRIKDANPLIGDQATETAVKQRLHQSRLIHLATHGIFSDKNGDPIQGYVVLAESEKDDGLLTVAEILDLTQGHLLNAEMIVLSACETGVGDIRGEGVVGLSRALIAAGVPSVVVSLWNVEDESTSLLMQYFYQNLLEKKMDKATALRQAMLDVSEEYPDPKHWAAFTLIGES